MNWKTVTTAAMAAATSICATAYGRTKFIYCGWDLGRATLDELAESADLFADSAADGVGTAIVVSNATLEASAAGGYGIWLGRSGSGQKLIVRGAMPRVVLNECKMSNGSALRFEIPADGYERGFAPLTARVLNPGNTATETIEIDCAAWCEKTGGKVTLLRTETAFSSSVATWLAAQTSGLPSGCRLVVGSNELALRSASKAATVFYVR